VRSFLLLAIVIFPITLTAAACTRERPTPASTPTSAAPASAPTVGPQATEVTISTPGSEAGLVITATTSANTTPAPGVTPTTGPQETFQYVVRDGDTLSAIAVRFETTLEILRRLNNLDSDNLLVGQPINVPYVEGMTAEGAPTPTPGPFLYTVQSGDTLSGLAARFGLSTIALMEANAENILDPNNLAVGSLILIPNYTPPASAESSEPGVAGAEQPGSSVGQESVIHVVQPGQGLIEIAALYGVTVVDITAANGLTEQDILNIGQELTIPGVNRREAAAARGALHVVQPEESLLSIAIQYGITVADIQAANDLDNPDSIFVGQELVIPLP
jgi:LysM repeat protein